MEKKEGLKPFKELVKFNLKDYAQKKPTFYRDKTGKLIKTDESKSSEIHPNKKNTLEIELNIDNMKFHTDYPIIDGNTIINEPNQLQLHKAELRGFVKAVAICTGLGLSLWMKEEKNLEQAVSEAEKDIKVKPKKKLPEDLFDKALESIEKGTYTVEQLKESYFLTNQQLEKLESNDSKSE
jgi:hypothetical protein